MKTIFVVVLSLFGLSMYLIHGSAAAEVHTLRGTIKDPSGAVIAGIRIKAEPGLDKYTSDTTDINGDFKLSLPVGEHVLTVDSPTPYGLKAFIKITEQGPNPDNVEFVIDPAKFCCKSPTGEPYPKPLSLPKPGYAPAARAVRAHGEVVVGLKIDREGKIVSTEVLSGHPLLRASSIAAAKGSLFEKSDKPERELQLVYVYIPDAENLRVGVTRYTNAYRIETTGEAFRLTVLG